MSDTSLQGGSLRSLATSASTRQRSSLFYGWWIVLIEAIGSTLYRLMNEVTHSKT